MPELPVVFLAYANDDSAHLDLLKQESRDTNRALRELDRKGIIKVLREESTEHKDIYENLLLYKNQISIFHYAGHASGKGLDLESGEGGAAGIAQQLGNQENLELVFLNGCSTQEQVAILFEAGVKAVIATSSPIQDRKASEFAISFYEALANRRNIEQAFQMATGYIKSKYGPAQELKTFRKINLGFLKKEQKEDELPWGLYVQDDSALSYMLPQARQAGLPKEILQYIGSSFNANKFIVSVLDDMVRYNPDIAPQMYEQKGEEIIKKDSKDYPEIIIRNFPWPIGSQIRLLRIQSQPNKDRLQTLLSTYIITSQTLYYILLSDLWNHKHMDQASLKQELNVKWDKGSYLQTDFLDHFLEAMSQLPQNTVLYVQELKDFYEELKEAGSKLALSHSFLKEQVSLIHRGEIAELERVCLKVEQRLAFLLKRLAFLARFRMMTVRNILIEQPRFSQLNYELEMGPLNASEAVHLRLYQDSERRIKSSFGNSHSVILVADEDLMHQGLNLSPFIIDKNTFVQVKKSNTTEMDTEDVAHIFLLGWADGAKLNYLTVNHSIFVALENEKGTDQIHSQMRQSDFTEGLNLGEEDWADEFDFFEGDGGDDSPKVFELLEKQYELFVKDFS